MVAISPATPSVCQSRNATRDPSFISDTGTLRPIGKRTDLGYDAQYRLDKIPPGPTVSERAHGI